MSNAEQKAEEADDGDEQPETTKSEFFERVALEGVTLQGDFFMARGTGRQRRYHKYDPDLVAGFDPIEEDGDVVAQEVSNHGEAAIEQVQKDHLEDVVFPKVRDGFGAFGLLEVESEAGSSDDSGSSEPEHEPMTDDEVLETIRQNYDEHGFFTEDDDGEQKVVSLPHPDARPMGYITGSHVKALPGEGLESVDDYRAAVSAALSDDDRGVVAGDVPIATDDMMETFEQSGGEVDEETRERLSKQVKRRWEDGKYDHLRKDDEDEDEQDD